MGATSFRRARISRHLWLGAVAAVLLSSALATVVLFHLYYGFAQARQNVVKLEQLRLVLNVANSISAERAPSNILMASDAAARAEVRAKLARARAETDRGVARAAGEGVPGPLIARVSRQLVVSRRLVDAAAAGTPPRYDDVQRAIDAMFSAYDAYQAIVEWQARALIGSNPALRAPVMQALVLCALRDDAGRLGSQIIASLATHTAVPAQNIQDFYRIRGRTEMQLELLKFEEDPAREGAALAALQTTARARFTGEGEPLIESLLAEGERGGQYTLNATGFTQRYVTTLDPLVAWRGAWIDRLVSDYTRAANRALVQFAIVFAVALAIAAMIVGIVLLVHARVLQPLLEASEAVIGLLDEQPVARRRHHRSVREIQVLFDTIDRLEVRLLERAAHTRRLKHQAETDDLTKLLNRRAFEALGKARLANSFASSRTFLILLDIDYFKSINDLHGHPMGDSVLVAVAGALSSSVRPGDLVARIGGEEFAILSETQDASKVLALAHRLQHVVRSLKLRTAGGAPIFVTASFGIAEGTGITWRQLVSRADVALYAAKSAGRDRIRYSGDGLFPNEHAAS